MSPDTTCPGSCYNAQMEGRPMAKGGGETSFCSPQTPSRSRDESNECSGTSELERWTGDQVVLGSNPAGATSLRNFGNSVYHALPVYFGGDTKCHRSLLSGEYARGSKRSHPGGKLWTPPLLEKDNSKINPVYK